PPVDLREAIANCGGEGVQVLLGAELARQGGHAARLDPAGHDPLERLQVVVDVDREAVRGDAAVDVDADRGDLTPGRRPDAGQAVDQTGLDVPVGERGDDRLLHS